MTKLVTDAERRGELLPLCISPGDFACSHQQPTMTDLKAARALSWLVEVVERILNKGVFDGNPEWQAEAQNIYRHMISHPTLRRPLLRLSHPPYRRIFIIVP